MSRTGRAYSPKVRAYNEAQQQAASARWKVVLELSKTHSVAEIAALMGLSRQSISRILENARRYFGEVENGAIASQPDVHSPKA